MRVLVKCSEVVTYKVLVLKSRTFENYCFGPINESSFVLQKEEVESYLIKDAKPIKIPFVLKNYLFLRDAF